MKTPTIFHAENIKTWPCQAEVFPGRWSLARPLGMPGINIFHRIRLAWLVFVGQCDALKWDEPANR